MELKRSDIPTIQQEIREERNWIESDLRRRRILRENISSQNINFTISNLSGKEPILWIVPPKGGPRPFFARVLDARSDELKDPEYDNIALGVEGLDELQMPKDRLTKIGQALPAFLDRFYTSTRQVPIRIFANAADLKAGETLMMIDFLQKENTPKISINENKLS